METLGVFTTKVWRKRERGPNFVVYAHKYRLQKELDDIRNQANTLNLERKKAQVCSCVHTFLTRQTAIGPSLERMEREWLEFVRKNIEIEKACTSLEEQISALKRA